MPIYDKNDRRIWYNNIPDRNQSKKAYNPFLDPNFDADKLKENEIDFGNGLILVKIPKIEHRIYRRDNEDHTKTYIEFIADQYYDKEKKQTRNKKVIIGEDFSHRLDGMMFINDNYRDYFDTKGNLFNDPMRRRREQKAQEKAEQEKERKQNNQSTQVKEEKEALIKNKTARSETDMTGTTPKETTGKIRPEERTVDEIKKALLQKEKLLDEKLQEAEQKKQEADHLLQRLEEVRQEMEEIRDVRIIELQERESARIAFLDDILDSHMNIVNEQAKRRPDTLMRLTQIRTINEILESIKEVAAGSESETYLHLAEEPAENDLKNHPGTTYGEMAILLSAYKWTLHAFRYGHVYEKDDEQEADEDGDFPNEEDDLQ